jgi:hypothetical protein
MKQLFVTSALVAISLVSATTAEAACRQVYGGTSCNWMGQCWHNPPKTVCDAPPPRIAAPPPQSRISVQPNVSGGRIINQDNAGLISNRAGGVISRDGAGLIGNAGGAMRR